jgi:hypothetical protein
VTVPAPPVRGVVPATLRPGVCGCASLLALDHTTCCVYVQTDKDEPTADEPKTMTFKPPTLNEEDKLSMTVPGQYACDACAAVAYQIQVIVHMHQCVCRAPTTWPV